MKKVLIASILCSGLMVGCSQETEKISFEESIEMQEEQINEEKYYIALSDVKIISKTINDDYITFDYEYGEDKIYNMTDMFADAYTSASIDGTTNLDVFQCQIYYKEIKSGETFKATEEDFERYMIKGEFEEINIK